MKIPDYIKNYYIWDGINPGYAMLYRQVAGEAGLLIYIFIRWQQNIPNYYTKQKSEWVKLSDVKMDRERFGMDTKTKNKAIRKLEKEGLVQSLYRPGKAPEVRLLVQ